MMLAPKIDEKQSPIHSPYHSPSKSPKPSKQVEASSPSRFGRDSNLSVRVSIFSNDE